MVGLQVISFENIYIILLIIVQALLQELSIFSELHRLCGAGGHLLRCPFTFHLI